MAIFPILNGEQMSNWVGVKHLPAKFFEGKGFFDKKIGWFTSFIFMVNVGVSKNSGTPKSLILIGFSIINHPFGVFSPYFWKHPCR